MIDSISFANNQLFWPILIGSVLLFLIFVWKEWRLVQGTQIAIRSIVALLTITSLAAMALRPMIKESRTSGKGILLTKGYHSNQLDSLKEAHKRIKIFDYLPNEHIEDSIKRLNSVFVLGNGVQTYDLWQFENARVTYFEGKAPQGIIRLKYAQNTTAGSNLDFRGVLNNPVEGHRLVLQDPGKNGLDSVILAGSEKEDFELSAAVSAVGRYLYHLAEKDSSGTIRSSEIMPVNSKPKKTLKILMLNGFPTFETKYLKNFLAATGHEVVVRSQLTKNKYKFESFNTERTSLYGLTQKNLADFDLLVIDASAYRSLGKNSFSELMEAVKTDGLGIFIQPDAQFFSRQRSPATFNFERSNALATGFEDWGKTRVDKFPYAFKQEFALQAVYTVQEEIVTAYRTMGNGKIGTSVVQNSYELLLEGAADEYKQFWSGVIETTAKKVPLPIDWDFKTQFAYKDRAHDFGLRTAMKEILLRTKEGQVVPLAQDPIVPQYWSGTSYPVRTGWHKYTAESDSLLAQHFYVGDSTQWRSIETYNRIQENKRFFRQSKEGSEHAGTVKPVNPLLFFLIFTLGMGYLWLVPKLFER